MPVIALNHTSAFRQVIHRLDDPDEFSIAVSGAQLSAFFLAPQAQPTRIEQYQTPAWTVDFHEANVHARIVATLPPGWASLGMMFSPRPSTWYGLDAPQGTLICTPPGNPIDGCTVPGFRCIAIGLSPEVWEQCRRIAGCDRATFGPCTAHALPSPMVADLEKRGSHLRRLLSEPGLSPAQASRVGHSLHQLATQIGITAWELSSSPVPLRDSLRNRARLARRAEAWLRDHHTQPLSVPQLCLALGVSRRELEYAFRTNFGTSPRDYLQTLRLHAVRRALLQSDRDHASITGIALDHGITHLSRFAASYHALFGELPSRTLMMG